MEENEEKVDPRFLPSNIISQGYRKHHRKNVKKKPKLLLIFFFIFLIFSWPAFATISKIWKSESCPNPPKIFLWKKRKKKKRPKKNSM
jgi:hypothetical protein